jgi:hypothetical protein
MFPRVLVALPFASLPIVVVVLWIASYWRSDDLEWQSPNRTLNVHSSNGYVVYLTMPIRNSKRTSWFSWQNERGSLTPVMTGFALNQPVARGAFESVRWAGLRYGVFAISVRHWVLFVLSLPIAAVGMLPFLRHVRRIRRGQGRCACCRYDLRGTPERCPECGTVAGAQR